LVVQVVVVVLLLQLISRRLSRPVSASAPSAS
jgi:hypothetical protein